jgi:hypothetical protein
VNTETPTRSITLRKFTFTRKHLAAIKQAHRNLFFFLGHAANEINCLAKLLLWTDMPLAHQDPRCKGAAVQTIMLSKLLLAKQLEASDVLFESYYRNPMRAELARYMPLDAKEAELSLEQYFAERESTIHYWIRNKFASHYELRHVGEYVQKARAAEDLVMYHGDNHANTLYEMADVVMNRAMLGGIDADSGAAIDKMVKAVSHVTALFLQFVDGFTIAIAKKAWRDQTHWGEVVEIEVAAHSAISIPWFSDLGQGAQKGE